MFDKKGVFIPVKNYECMIDTGSSRSIAAKKILYSEWETVIMQQCIAALAKVGHIHGRSQMGVGSSKCYLCQNPTRSTSKTLMILSGASVLITFPLTVLFESLLTLSHNVILRCLSSLVWGNSSGCLMRLWDIISLPLLLQVRKSLRFWGSMP